MSDDIDLTWQPSIKDWAEAASQQCRASNRVLVVVVSVASFIVLAGSYTSDDYRLPILDIDVSKDVFFQASFALLVISMVAFAATFCQAHLVVRRVHHRIDELDSSIREVLRTRFDSFVIGAWSRVAPIELILKDVGLIRGPRWQFAIYLLLKMTYWCVAFGLPIWASMICFLKIESCGLRLLAGCCGLVSLLVYCGLAYLEYRWVRDRWRLQRGDRD